MHGLGISWLVTVLAVGFASVGMAAERPNILWFVVDDMSANFSCYGESAIQTPNVDRLAAEGVRFTHAYATAPVCSTFRSAMITGMYQTTIHAHHHRSGRGEHRIRLPANVRPIPALMKEAGYYTCIGSGLLGWDYRTRKIAKGKERRGKTDYNFDWDPAMYDSHDWSGRGPEQPFFMQVQLHGGKLRGAAERHYDQFAMQVKDLLGTHTKEEHLELPPYYPRDSVLLRDWAAYLDSVRVTDYHVGLVMERLRREGLLENTLVVFFTDHGISHARGKQFLYDEGTHIPLIVRGPGMAKGITRADLVEHIDVAALSLAAAGLQIPAAMQGRDVLSRDYEPRQAVFAARDRCGEAADRIRSVRTDRYLYIKNFYPQRPLLMPSSYKDSKLILQRLRALHASGDLAALSGRVLFAEERPSEELYLYKTDRWQTQNLSSDPQHAEALREHRERLARWMADTGDPGPESLEVYLLETQDQIDSTRNQQMREQYETNRKLYLRWVQDGK